MPGGRLAFKERTTEQSKSSISLCLCNVYLQKFISVNQMFCVPKLINVFSVKARRIISLRAH